LRLQRKSEKKDGENAGVKANVNDTKEEGEKQIKVAHTFYDLPISDRTKEGMHICQHKKGYIYLAAG
jgi:hypothetical protein